MSNYGWLRTSLSLTGIRRSSLSWLLANGLNSVLCRDEQINNIWKTAFLHLRNMAKIRKVLSHCQCEILIHAFISSKFDYCNVLLSGLQ